MPLREDIFVPIPGENPSGDDLRYDPVYDQIKESRRQDDDLARGAWESERKTANWPVVLKVTQEFKDFKAQLAHKVLRAIRAIRAIRATKVTKAIKVSKVM